MNRFNNILQHYVRVAMICKIKKQEKFDAIWEDLPSLSPTFSRAGTVILIRTGPNEVRVCEVLDGPGLLRAYEDLTDTDKAKIRMSSHSFREGFLEKAEVAKETHKVAEKCADGLATEEVTSARAAAMAAKAASLETHTEP